MQVELPLVENVFSSHSVIDSPTHLKPALHGTQLDLLESLVWPFGHTLHSPFCDIEPVWHETHPFSEAEYPIPEGHFSQLEDLAIDISPTGQGVHSLAPALEKVLAGQIDSVVL